MQKLVVQKLRETKLDRCLSGTARFYTPVLSASVSIKGAFFTVCVNTALGLSAAIQPPATIVRHLQRIDVLISS